MYVQIPYKYTEYRVHIQYMYRVQSTEYRCHICTFEYRCHICTRVQSTDTIYVQRTEYKIPNMYRVQSTDAIYVQCTVRYCIYSSKVHTLATLLYRSGTVQVTNWYLELKITKLYIYILTLYHVERK